MVITRGPPSVQNVSLNRLSKHEVWMIEVNPRFNLDVAKRALAKTPRKTLF
jgi:hypothetical protein